MEGVIVKSTGTFYLVKAGEEMITARIRGKFRLKNHRLTNPIAVGDVVELSEEGDTEGIRVITEIKDRKNYIIRKSNKLSSRAQIIASNLDNALLFITLKEPVTSTGFIDRFLITAEAYHIPSILVFNKVDCYNPAEIKVVDSYCQLYTEIGYTCFKINSTDPNSVKTLTDYLQNKTCLISGHSGVGKSTFVNHLLKDTNQKTKEISSSSSRGQHTTTFAEMFLGPQGIRIIDTPGISDFGVIDIPEKEISHYFIEFRKHLNNCKYNDCIHTNEPQCAIIEAVANGEIDEERYYNYLSIMRNDDSHR
jgi:ribosome biogenesis GTPase